MSTPPIEPNHDIGQLLREGLAFHQQGQISDAAARYLEVLARQAHQPDALHLLGVTKIQTGDNTGAIPDLRRAVALRPIAAEYRHHLGCALLAAEQLADAVEAFEHALVVAPDHGEAIHNLGQALRQAGQFAEAARYLLRAVAIRPEVTDWRIELAACLRETDRSSNALKVLADISASGSISIELCFEFALAHRALDQVRAAEPWLRRAVLLAPSNTKLLNNMAQSEVDHDRTDAAARLGNWAAMTAPHDVTIRTNRAIFLLINGNLAAGWQEFRWRHGKPEVALERLGLPVEWTGAALVQGTLLVWQEQGIGDEVLFVSCVRDVARQSKAPVIVECEPRLRALFARSFPEAEFIDKLKRTVDTPARVDFSDLVEARGISAHCGIGELALFARTKLETFPKKPGYLIPSPQKRAHWRTELDALGPETKIGLCWRSSLRSSEIDHYFVSIEGMAPILKLPGARFVNLQYDDCEAELAHAEAALGVEIIRPQGINLRNDLDDVAALISELDLVISTSTSVLAMSGAIGVPAIGLFLKRDWTFLGQPNQPWYPSVTPVIKGANRTWAETIEVAAEITREHL